MTIEALHSKLRRIFDSEGTVVRHSLATEFKQILMQTLIAYPIG